MRAPAVLLCLLALLAAPALADARRADATPAPRDPVGTLTLRQLAGQRIVVGYAGSRVPSWLVGRVRRGEVGGVIVFTRNIASVPAVRAQMRRLQAVRRPLAAPLLTMVDQEGGLVKRLPGSPAQSAARMGLRGAEHVRRAGRATATTVRGAGLNTNLAPVLDLGRAGSYQHRTERAFARRPADVAALGSAFAQGLAAGGVVAALKHFPGLGAVTRDEDAVVQTVGLSRAALRGADEVPFAAAIRAGAPMVMTSTARYPAFDTRPALLSRVLTTDELRGRLGFRGVAVTDDLDVVALAAEAAGRLAIDATLAGNDLLLFAQSPGRAAQGLDAVVRAVRGGRLTRAALEASVDRIAALRSGLAG